MQRSLASSLLWLPLLLAPPASAQLPRIAFSGGFSGGPDGFKGDASFQLARPMELKANAPYSGEEKVEHTQTLADGTHITSKAPLRTQKVWRDSQGRVRIEQSFGGGPHYPSLTQIDDPVAGYIYIMDGIDKIAHRVKASVVPQRNMDPLLMMRRAPTEALGGGGGGGGFADGGAVAAIVAVGASPGAAPANGRVRPQISAPEDLGTQVIDGVSVHGSRITTVIPTGAQGNDGPITTTRDSWYSPDLNMVIQTVSNDPRSGTQTTGIANLSRAEPDPGLFMIPPDYTIIDENSSFNIKWDTTAGVKQQ